MKKNERMNENMVLFHFTHTQTHPNHNFEMNIFEKTLTLEVKDDGIIQCFHFMQLYIHD